MRMPVRKRGRIHKSSTSTLYKNRGDVPLQRQFDAIFSPNTEWRNTSACAKCVGWKEELPVPFMAPPLCRIWTKSPAPFMPNTSGPIPCIQTYSRMFRYEGFRSWSTAWDLASVQKFVSIVPSVPHGNHIFCGCAVIFLQQREQQPQQ